MAGIFDTLAQVRMETPDAGAEWAKQVEAANARAAAIKAARGAAAGITPTVPGATPGIMGRLAAQFPWTRSAMGVVPGAMNRVGSAVPGWMSGTGILGGAGAVTAAVPEVLGQGGVLDVANDPAATKIDVASRVGRGMTRVGLTAAGTGIGAAAGGGLLSIPLAAAGGYAGNKLADWILPENSDPPAFPTFPTLTAALPPAPGFGVTPAPRPATVSTDMDAHRKAYDAANSAPGGFMSPGGYNPGPQPDRYGVLPKYDANGNLTGSANSKAGVTWNANTGQPEGGKFAAAGGYNNWAAGRDLDAAGPGGNSFGAVMGRGAAGMLNIKRETGIARQAAAQAKLGAEMALGYDKIRADLMGKGATAAKAEAEADSIRRRQKIADAEPDPIKRAAILAGHNPPETRLQSPVNMQPMPGDRDQSAVVFDPAKGTYTRVPIRTQIRGGVGTDGKYYKTDTAGKQVEMTPAEKAQFLSQQRGFGAVQ